MVAAGSCTHLLVWIAALIVIVQGSASEPEIHQRRLAPTGLRLQPLQPVIPRGDEGEEPTRRQRRHGFTVMPEMEADEYFRDYRTNECKLTLPSTKISEAEEQPCRHSFIKEQFGRMFAENPLFGDINSWMDLKGDRKLSVRNVILQSGTAVWMHGCRRDQMTNDVDAWIAPVSPNTLVFNNPKQMPSVEAYKQQPFVWEPHWHNAFHISFTGDGKKVFERRLNQGETREADKEIEFGDNDDKEFKLLTDGEQVKGHLARIEYLRNGKVYIYLNHFAHDANGHLKASGTKDAKVRIRKGSLVYAPMVENGKMRLTFELDLYTPFGALDGDYQWPWLASLSYLRKHIPKDTEMPVIPKHVAIVQKLKLYFDTFLSKNKDHPKAGLEPHRVKHESENEHTTQFFIRNYKKMAQDIDDMQCLCERCHEHGEEDCIKLCSIVDVILSGEVKELPSKQQLFKQYEAELKSRRKPSMVKGVTIDKTHLKVHPPPATERFDEHKRSTIAKRLSEFQTLLDGEEWKEATLQRVFKAQGVLQRAIDTFSAERKEDPQPSKSMFDSLCMFSSNCAQEG